MTAHVSPPIRLTRRDRAALVLAYEACRECIEDKAGRVRLAAVGIRSQQAQRALGAGGDFAWALMTAFASADQVKRYKVAALALLIRAVLRADAGDVGPVAYTPKVARPDAEREACAASHGGGVRFCCAWEERRPYVVPYVALWERARAVTP